MSISDEDESKKLNEILGLNHEERLNFYNQIFQNNYLKNKKGEIKISNGAFYNSDNIIENTNFNFDISIGNDTINISLKPVDKEIPFYYNYESIIIFFFSWIISLFN